MGVVQSLKSGLGRDPISCANLESFLNACNYYGINALSLPDKRQMIALVPAIHRLEGGGAYLF
jgi:hypothetical protein